jgi:hypothetical protein
VNQIKAFAVGLAAVVRESEQPAWDLTNEVIDGSVSWQRLSRSLGKLSNLPANGPDRQRRSLKSMSFYRKIPSRFDTPLNSCMQGHYAK